MTDSASEKPSGPPPVTRTTWLVLGTVVALFLLCGGGTMGLSLLSGLLLTTTGLDTVMRAEEEGKVYGQSHTEAECVTEALRREWPECGDGTICSTIQANFLEGCLRTAPAEPSICTDVPSSLTKQADAWATAFCEQRPEIDPVACRMVADQIPVSCTLK